MVTTVRLSFVVGIGALLSLAGCPSQQTPITGGPVTAVINVSATSGPAPLSVTANANGSASTEGTVSTYSWTLNGDAVGAGTTVTVNLANPGRHTLGLTVRDSVGNVGITTQQIRVQGDGEVNAVITTDRDTGPARLGVQFDGTDSNAEDDTIYDYFWDFGDGATARGPEPFHVFDNEGTYTVTLRVVTGGGIEATTTYTINVTGGGEAGSLDFAGSEYATLSIIGAPYEAVTLMMWFKPDANGGFVATLGSQELILAVAPTTGELVARRGSQNVSALTSNITGTWHHLAVTYDTTDPNEGVAIFLDGRELARGGISGDLNAEEITLGGGYDGKIAQVIMWSRLLSEAQIQSQSQSPPTSADADLVGYWPIDDGEPREFITVRFGLNDGVLGATGRSEAVDPSWSADGPP